MCPLKYFRIWVKCAPFKQQIWFRCAPSNFRIWLKCAPFKQWVWLKCAPFKQQIWLKCSTEVSFAATAFKILIYSWFTHFCREFSFVAITRFLGGTFGQNLVGGGTKTFYRTGGWWTGGEAPRMMHREWYNRGDALGVVHQGWCTEVDAQRMMHWSWCTRDDAPKVMHQG